MDEKDKTRRRSPEDQAVIDEIDARQAATYRPENHPFPKMVYRVQRHKDTGERYNEERIVNSEDELRAAKSDGWGPAAEAYTKFEAQERALSMSAAQRAFDDRNMSDKAKAEIARDEERSGGKHVLDVDTKKKKD